MKNHPLAWIIVGVLVAVTLIGQIIPRLKKHSPDVNPDTIDELMVESSVSFDAPLYELAMGPFSVYRVESVQGSTIVVGVYGWFGLRTAKLHFTDCRSGREGLVNQNFSCGGSTVEYAF